MDSLMEAPWGADPLEFEGGFRALHYDPDAWFRGSLVPGASVPWTTFNAKSISHDDRGSKLTLQVAFGEVDWQFLQKVYGWSALQYQAWARGYIDISGESPNDVILYTEHVLEFWLDGVPHFGGDFYAYRRAPLVLHLDPGHHQLDVRLIRDVRAMGGIGSPDIEVSLEVRRAAEPLELSEAGILISDVVEGRLAGSLGSITVRNNGRQPLEIISIRALHSAAQIDLRTSTRVAAGQTKPIAFDVKIVNSEVSALDLEVEYQAAGGNGFVLTLQAHTKILHRSVHEPHLMTFFHFGGIVSYAMLKPPAWNTPCPSNSSEAPVLLALHGAGVEARSDAMRHSLDNIQGLCAWTLFPTGTTNWSGDDWHTWGFADVEAAIEHIALWIKSTGWQGVGVDTDRWLVVGHSNGGQGTWYALTHRPDKVIGAAPVSGYSSIQNYVPYYLWQYADPAKMAVVQASLNSFRHEMMVENAKAIPVLQQHGVYDDNVPTFHSRLMHERLHRAGTDTEYVEVFKGHWFDGAMETDPLRNFYETHLNLNDRGPHTLKNFTIVVANPADVGSKGGLTVQHLVDPGQYGRVKVSAVPLKESCGFTTSNILIFNLNERYRACRVIEIDGQTVHSGWAPRFSRDDFGIWKGIAVDENENKPSQRGGAQLGNMDSILRTNGSFIISYNGPNASHIALQVSRNLFQYYGADSEIVDKMAPPSGHYGNLISICSGSSVPKPQVDNFPLQISGGTIRIRDHDGNERAYEQDEAGSAIFVRPFGAGRLELVIWGADAERTFLAARLMPTLTGVGQPDFIVLSDNCKWKGVDGAVALGFFGHKWNVTRSSYLS